MKAYFDLSKGQTFVQGLYIIMVLALSKKDNDAKFLLPNPNGEQSISTWGKLLEYSRIN